MNEKVLTPLASRLKRRLEATGKSMRSVSLAIGSDALIRNIMAGKSKSPRAENLEAIARELGTTTSWLLHEEGPELAADQPAIVVQSPLRTRSDLPPVPVRGVAAGSHEKGAFQFTGDEIDFVERPTALNGLRNLYAIYVIEDSMYPEHKHGDLRFASPDRPARPGDTVLIEAQDDTDEGPWAMIGNLVRRGDEVVIQKLNPEREIRIPSILIKTMHKVLTQNDLFGR